MRCPNCSAGLPDGCASCPPKTIKCYKCGAPVVIGGGAWILDKQDVKVRI